MTVRESRRRPIREVVFGCGLALLAQAMPATSQSTPGSEALALPDLQTRLQVARDATRQHQDMLRTQLGEAIRTSGLKGAIGTCKTLSPELNTTVGDQAGIEIRRTALRLRNIDNVPDSWELANLDLFLKQLAAGTDHKTVEAFDVVTTKEGQKLFRFMRPIMTGEVCLGCHGAAMPQDIKQEIARNYPDDKATGFNLGELRGAFSVIQEVE